MSRPTFENGIWKGIAEDMAKDYLNLGERMFKQFKQFPEIIGQIDPKTEEKETFATMGEKAIRCALWLKKQGIKSGDVVGFCSGNHLDSWVPMVACFYIGAIFNPWWDSSLDEELTKYFIELTEPKILFITEEFIDLTVRIINNSHHKMKTIVFGKKSNFESFKDILKSINAEEIKGFQCRQVENPQEPIMILYTSGTSSQPKGVLHSYGSLARIINFEPKKGLPNTINLWFSGLCWISGILAFMQAILFGSTIIISHDLNEEEACKLIERYKVSWITMGTSVASRICKTKAALKYDLSSLVRGSYGGTIAKKEVIEFLRNTFMNAYLFCVYGCTESGVMVYGEIKSSKLTSCGNVVPNSEIKLIKPDTGEIVEPHEEGEICYRGPQVMLGYWKNPEATKETIDSEGWFHTGDLAYYDEDGDFFIVERIKELIKYLYHVHPAAIESVIHDHPGVAEVAVVAKPDDNGLEQPLAFITKIPGAQVTEEEIHELVNNNLHDRFKLRGGICFLDKMPHTASGKIAKKELRVMAKKFDTM